MKQRRRISFIGKKQKCKIAKAGTNEKSELLEFDYEVDSFFLFFFQSKGRTGLCVCVCLCLLLFYLIIINRESFNSVVQQSKHTTTHRIDFQKIDRSNYFLEKHDKFNLLVCEKRQWAKTLTPWELQQNLSNLTSLN